jgi:predicted permease
MVQNLRLAWRSLRRTPGFTTAAATTLALGVGANTAIFSVVDGVLFKSLPYREPERVLMLWEDHPKEGNARYNFSPANYADVRDRVASFEHLGAINPYGTVNLTGVGDPQTLPLLRVSSSVFPALGITPQRGRALQPEDDQPNSASVVVISDGFWRTQLGGDSNAIGRTLTLNGDPYTVVGVMPAGVTLPTVAGDLIAPLAFNERTWQLRAVHFLILVGALKPGISPEAARSELGGIAARLAQDFPGTNEATGITAIPVLEAVVGEVRPVLLLLLGAVGLVLVIACANVGNLLIVRATARRRELAVRSALGARPRHLAGYLLAESLVLAGLGGALGLVLAVWGVDLLRALGPEDMPRLTDIGIDWRVLGFTLAVVVATGLIFGLAPVLQVLRPSLVASLKDGERGPGNPAQGQRARAVLVVSQVALALMLLVGAGLMFRSIRSLLNVDPGVQPDHALTLQVRVAGPRYQDPMQTIAFTDQLTAEVAALPGVKGAGAINAVPFGPRGPTSWLTIETRPLSGGTPPEVEYRSVTDGYFGAMGIPLLRGNLLTRPPGAGDSTLPVVVSEALARQFFPETDPLGQRIRLGPNPQAAWRTIVGVVGDVRERGLAEPARPDVYVPAGQSPSSSMSLVVRTVGDPLAIAGPVREVVRRLDPDAAISNVTALDALVRRSVARPQFALRLFGVFAAVALALAAIGTYGVMSYIAARRAGEIGIRMALGARPGDVRRLVLSSGLGAGLAGIGLGLLGALGATRAMTSMLHQISPTDPLTYAGVALLLLLVLAAACYLPARRASRADPMTALRAE